ncbi:MAG TPA: GNAT family N-acetyltransferase [Chitinophaga sp.]|nr:GNAT family N-acetyltransferase [Chitinophaga sp.]
MSLSTKSTYHIQEASVKDIPTIQQLAEQIWRPTYKSILTPEQVEYMMNMMYSTESLTSQLTKQKHHYLILYNIDAPIGYASYAYLEAPGIYKLHKIYLHQDYQGKGIGKLLISTVIDKVTAAQGTILELDVNRDNKAKLFYEKQGFSVYKEKDTNIGNGYWMNDYVMRKPL